MSRIILICCLCSGMLAGQLAALPHAHGWGVQECDEHARITPHVHLCWFDWIWSPDHSACNKSIHLRTECPVTDDPMIASVSHHGNTSRCECSNRVAKTSAEGTLPALGAVRWTAEECEHDSDAIYIVAAGPFLCKPSETKIRTVPRFVMDATWANFRSGTMNPQLHTWTARHQSAGCEQTAFQFIGCERMLI